jgi:isocitrate dehydrogenase kinase/phosphatase
MEEHHGWLFTPEFWQELQGRILAGELLDFFPYPQEKRFCRQQNSLEVQG